MAVYFLVLFPTDVQKEALILAQDPAVDEARVGDRFGWNCTFGQSRPSAHITWLVNGESVRILLPVIYILFDKFVLEARNLKTRTEKEGETEFIY